jgi:hypothetical protein
MGYAITQQNHYVILSCLLSLTLTLTLTLTETTAQILVCGNFRGFNLVTLYDRFQCA